MPSTTLSFSTENTTLILNGHGFNNYQDGDILELTWVNPLTVQSRGPAAVNIMKRSDSGVIDLTVRVMRYSDDDVYLNTQKNQNAPVIFNGTLTENYVDASGTNGVGTYSLSAGSLTDQPPQIINNIDGNFLMEYKFRFNDVIRVI